MSNERRINVRGQYKRKTYSQQGRHGSKAEERKSEVQCVIWSAGRRVKAVGERVGRRKGSKANMLVVVVDSELTLPYSAAVGASPAPFLSSSSPPPFSDGWHIRLPSGRRAHAPATAGSERSNSA